jgi:hypothetical protein
VLHKSGDEERHELRVKAETTEKNFIIDWSKIKVPSVPQLEKEDLDYVEKSSKRSRK